MRKLLLILGAILAGCVCLSAVAAETIPPAPSQYFNDYAGVVSPGVAAQLNQELQQFERDTSSQVLVVVYAKMQSDSSIEDYTTRVFESWKVGQKGKDNGAVLFVFIQDHQMYITTGYGLEGALPDALCKRIIESDIKPCFKAGNYEAGLTAGVNSILAAAKGEYKGNGQTAGGRKQERVQGGLAVLFIIIFILLALSNRRRGGYYSGGGWTVGGFGGGWGGGGGWSGGGGGGGGFSGGGGRTGGGGAGGSW